MRLRQSDRPEDNGGIVMRTPARAVGLLLAAGLFSAGICRASERAGTVTFAIDLNAPAGAKTVRLWFPYPTSDLDQTIRNLNFTGNYTSFTLAREPVSGALYLYAQWDGPMRARTMKVTFLAAANERKVPKLVDSRDAVPPEARKYLESDFWIPAGNPRIVAQAREIMAGRTGILAKARAIYDWVVDNFRRDANVAGCGLGLVDAALAARSGKCADISSVFVAIARAAGVPAREVFGLRLGRQRDVDISDGNHCWAEFYLPGSGWVPVDPADVVAYMSAKDFDRVQAQRYREYYFGAVDEFRMVLHKGGRGIAFVEGNVQRVNYFMYPYAEVDGKPLDYCRPRAFRYVIRFRRQ